MLLKDSLVAEGMSYLALPLTPPIKCRKNSAIKAARSNGMQLDTVQWTDKREMPIEDRSVLQAHLGIRCRYMHRQNLSSLIPYR